MEPVYFLPHDDSVVHACRVLTNACFEVNENAGWHHDIETGDRKIAGYGDYIALIHSELSESFEAYRKRLNDDHLPDYPGQWVEIADALIRVFDMLGVFGVDVGEIVKRKLAYNQSRADHKPENRRKDGGKKI